jgi:hypothetical protein
MGGAKAGNVASSMAVDYFENILTDKLISFKDADEIIGDIVYDANRLFMKSQCQMICTAAWAQPL